MTQLIGVVLFKPIGTPYLTTGNRFLEPPVVLAQLIPLVLRMIEVVNQGSAADHLSA